MYDNIWMNKSSDDLWSYWEYQTDNDKNKSDMSIIGCQYGWEYNTTYFTRTAPSDHDWVCDETWKVTLSFQMGNIAVSFGAIIFGYLGDHWGRRPVFTLALTVTVCAFIIRLFVAQWFWVYAVMCALVNGTIPSMFQMPITIALELANKKLRAKLTMLICVSWVGGMCLLPLLAWLTKDWILLGIVTTVPCLLFYIAIWYLPESPRWLLTQGETERATAILKRVAKINGRSISSDFDKEIKQVATQNVAAMKVQNLFKSKRLIGITAGLTIGWIANTIGYNMLTLGASIMPGSPFMNFFLLALVELPGNLVGGWSVDTRLGRRWTHFLFLFLCAIGCVVVVATGRMEGGDWIITCMTILTKMCVTLSFYVVYLQAVELYPTSYRTSGMAFCSTAANIVAYICPWLVEKGAIDIRIPYAILGLVAFVAAIAVSFLPETFNHTLPQALEDMERLGKGQKFFSLAPKQDSQTKVAADEEMKPINVYKTK